MRGKKPDYLMKTVLYGLASAMLYALVFMNTETIMPYFTAGSYLAALPIATVFAFSFVHGTFASSLWSALGIEAAKPQVRTTAVARKRPAQRPRLRLHV